MTLTQVLNELIAPLAAIMVVGSVATLISVACLRLAVFVWKNKW